MATEDTKSKEDTQNPEDFLMNIAKNPFTTFGGGLIGGYLLGNHISNQKIEKLEKQHELQKGKRDEQFARLMEQMVIASKRQDQFIKIFSAYSGQKIEDLEEDPVDGIYKNKNKYKFGKKYVKI